MSSRRFSCTIRHDGVRVGGESACFVGHFCFTKTVALGAKPVRRFETVSLSATDGRGVVYRVLGPELAEQDRGAADGMTFRCRHRGVLVGPGRLNNQLLTLVIEFAERADGTATADAIAARVDILRSKRGMSPDCGPGEPA